MSFNRFFNAGKPWTILVPLGLLIVGCVSAHLYINHRAIAKVAEAARQAYYNRKFDAADREIRRWIELLPNSGEPWYWKARIELAREHPQETLNALQNAHDRGYAEKELEVITAIMEVFSGKYDQHEPTLKQAFEQTTTPAPELDQALSRLYLASYQFASATKTLQRWMKDAPDDPRPYLWLNKIDERTSTDVARRSTPRTGRHAPNRPTRRRGGQGIRRLSETQPQERRRKSRSGPGCSGAGRLRGRDQVFQ